MKPPGPALPARWIAADEVYGTDPGLRADLEKRCTGYVLAVACRHQVSTGLRQHRADQLARGLPRTAWPRRPPCDAGGTTGAACYG